jgi:septum formation protein
LILASASPRRAELLRAAGIDFEIVRADIDESVLEGEAPAQHVTRLAAAKARAVIVRADDRPVLAADTVVVVDDQILGKPSDSSDARRMLRMLSGRSHEVLTGVCLACRASPSGSSGGPDKARPTEVTEVDSLTEVEVTTVEFAPLTDAEIDWYVASGEPGDKAGAYAIQGLASRFVVRIQGSYSNVVGLPVSLVYRLCRAQGLLIS